MAEQNDWIAVTHRKVKKVNKTNTTNPSAANTVTNNDSDAVVLRRTIKREEHIQRGNYVVEKKFDAGKNTKNKPQVNAKKIEEDEDYKPPIITHDLKLKLQ